MSAPQNAERFYNGKDTDDNRLGQMAATGIDRISVEALEVLDLRAADTVLDIGSGPHGTIGEVVGAVGAEYIALDIDEHAVQEQKAAGHAAFVAAAHALPLADNSVNAIHSRFCGGWQRNTRKQAFDEWVRVGAEDLFVVDIEFDWSVASGHPVYERLLGMMTGVLRPAGFEPNLGAFVHEEIARYAQQKLGETGYTTLETRQPIPADTLAEKLEVIEINVKSIADKLLEWDRDDEAAALRAQMDLLKSEDLTTEDIRLADVVSVIFALTGKEQMRSDNLRHLNDGKMLGTLTLALAEKEDVDQSIQIWRLRPGWDKHPLGIKGMKFFEDRYVVAGYVDPAGLAHDVFQEAIDPADLRARSEMFLALRPDGEAESSVRGIYPNEAGLVSLPTGKKLIEKYGRGSIPEFMKDESTSEIGFYVSMSKNPLVMVRSITAAVEAAREAGMSHILYGSVSGPITKHFNNIFGPGKGLRPLMIGDEVASVTVEGPPYAAAGIPLTLGYINTATFLTDVIGYYTTDKLNSRYAADIITLCRQLSNVDGELPV